jgi:hypothetical protein
MRLPVRLLADRNDSGYIKTAEYAHPAVLIFKSPFQGLVGYIAFAYKSATWLQLITFQIAAK